MPVSISIWHGTDEELQALQRAVGRNCECAQDGATCIAHQMLTDQRVLDHLAFIKHIEMQLQIEEWTEHRDQRPR